MVLERNAAFFGMVSICNELVNYILIALQMPVLIIRLGALMAGWKSAWWRLWNICTA